MEKEKFLYYATLAFLVKDDKILLAKKLKKIGKDCWNGYGGGIESAETPEECVLRELLEEAKITTTLASLEKVALIHFHNLTSQQEYFVCRVHVFFVNSWEGEPQASEEMADPTWFPKYQLPFECMMPADRIWLPLVCQGKKIRARASYGPHQKVLLGEVILKEVDDFSGL
jgi:8-oxo-dGTP diphosphatase